MTATSHTLPLSEFAPWETPPTAAEACAGSCVACPSVGSCAERLVCRCLRVTEETVIAAIRTRGATTVVELRTVTGAGDGCRCCHRELKQYLAVYAPASSSSPSMC